MTAERMLSDEELAAIASTWKERRHEFVTSFDGTSMLPAIAPGQPVRIQCGIEPAMGDVAVFRREGGVGVHRMVARGENWRLTWGDANPLPDAPIAPDQLLGTVSMVATAPRSLHRGFLLRLLTAGDPDTDRMARRIRSAHALRSAWEQGPVAFARKCLRALARRLVHLRSRSHG